MERSSKSSLPQLLDLYVHPQATPQDRKDILRAIYLEASSAIRSNKYVPPGLAYLAGLADKGRRDTHLHHDALHNLEKRLKAAVQGPNERDIFGQRMVSSNEINAVSARLERLKVHPRPVSFAEGHAKDRFSEMAQELGAAPGSVVAFWTHSNLHWIPVIAQRALDGGIEWHCFNEDAGAGDLHPMELEILEAVGRGGPFFSHQMLPSEAKALNGCGPIGFLLLQSVDAALSDDGLVPPGKIGQVIEAFITDWKSKEQPTKDAAIVATRARMFQSAEGYVDRDLAIVQDVFSDPWMDDIARFPLSVNDLVAMSDSASPTKAIIERLSSAADLFLRIVEGRQDKQIPLEVTAALRALTSVAERVFTDQDNLNERELIATRDALTKLGIHGFAVAFDEEVRYRAEASPKSAASLNDGEVDGDEYNPRQAIQFSPMSTRSQHRSSPLWTAEVDPLLPHEAARATKAPTLDDAMSQARADAQQPIQQWVGTLLASSPADVDSLKRTASALRDILRPVLDLAPRARDAEEARRNFKDLYVRVLSPTIAATVARLDAQQQQALKQSLKAKLESRGFDAVRQYLDLTHHVLATVTDGPMFSTQRTLASEEAARLLHALMLPRGRDESSAENVSAAFARLNRAIAPIYEELVVEPTDEERDDARELVYRRAASAALRTHLHAMGELRPDQLARLRENLIDKLNSPEFTPLRDRLIFVQEQLPPTGAASGPLHAQLSGPADSSVARAHRKMHTEVGKLLNALAYESKAPLSMPTTRDLERMLDSATSAAAPLLKAAPELNADALFKLHVEQHLAATEQPARLLHLQVRLGLDGSPESLVGAVPIEERLAPRIEPIKQALAQRIAPLLELPDAVLASLASLNAAGTLKTVELEHFLLHAPTQLLQSLSLKESADVHEQRVIKAARNLWGRRLDVFGQRFLESSSKLTDAYFAHQLTSVTIVADLSAAAEALTIYRESLPLTQELAPHAISPETGEWVAAVSARLDGVLQQLAQEGEKNIWENLDDLQLSQAASALELLGAGAANALAVVRDQLRIRSDGPAMALILQAVTAFSEDDRSSNGMVAGLEALKAVGHRVDEIAVEVGEKRQQQVRLIGQALARMELPHLYKFAKVMSGPRARRLIDELSTAYRSTPDADLYGVMSALIYLRSKSARLLEEATGRRLEEPPARFEHPMNIRDAIARVFPVTRPPGDAQRSDPLQEAIDYLTSPPTPEGVTSGQAAQDGMQALIAAGRPINLNLTSNARGGYYRSALLSLTESQLHTMRRNLGLVEAQARSNLRKKRLGMLPIHWRQSGAPLLNELQEGVTHALKMKALLNAAAGSSEPDSSLSRKQESAIDGLMTELEKIDRGNRAITRAAYIERLTASVDASERMKLIAAIDLFAAGPGSKANAKERAMLAALRARVQAATPAGPDISPAEPDAAMYERVRRQDAFVFATARLLPTDKHARIATQWIERKRQSKLSLFQRAKEAFARRVLRRPGEVEVNPSTTVGRITPKGIASRLKNIATADLEMIMDRRDALVVSAPSADLKRNTSDVLDQIAAELGRRQAPRSSSSAAAVAPVTPSRTDSVPGTPKKVLSQIANGVDPLVKQANLTADPEVTGKFTALLTAAADFDGDGANIQKQYVAFTRAVGQQDVTASAPVALFTLLSARMDEGSASFGDDLAALMMGLRFDVVEAIAALPAAGHQEQEVVRIASLARFARDALRRATQLHPRPGSSPAAMKDMLDAAMAVQQYRSLAGPEVGAVPSVIGTNARIAIERLRAKANTPFSDEELRLSARHVEVRTAARNGSKPPAQSPGSKVKLDYDVLDPELLQVASLMRTRVEINRKSAALKKRAAGAAMTRDELLEIKAIAGLFTSYQRIEAANPAIDDVKRAFTASVIKFDALLKQFNDQLQSLAPYATPDQLAELSAAVAQSPLSTDSAAHGIAQRVQVLTADYDRAVDQMIDLVNQGAWPNVVEGLKNLRARVSEIRRYDKDFREDERIDRAVGALPESKRQELLDVMKGDGGKMAIGLISVANAVPPTPQVINEMLQMSNFLERLRGSPFDISQADALKADPLRRVLRDAWSIEAGEGDQWVRTSGPAPEAVERRVQAHVATLDLMVDSHRYSDARGRFDAQVSRAMWDGFGDPRTQYVFDRVPLPKPAAAAAPAAVNKVKTNAVSVMRERLENPELLSTVSAVANPAVLFGIVEQFNREDTPIRSRDGMPLGIQGREVTHQIHIQPLGNREALVHCEVAVLDARLQPLGEGSSAAPGSPGYATFKFSIRVGAAPFAQLVPGSLSYLYRLSSWPAPFPEPVNVDSIMGPNANMALKAAFKAYVEQQLIPYNVRFLETLADWEAQPYSQRRANTPALMEFFNADNDLNLSSDLRTRIKQAYRPLTHNLAEDAYVAEENALISALDSARDECRLLMATNEIPRFRRAIKEGTYLRPPGR